MIFNVKNMFVYFFYFIVNAFVLYIIVIRCSLIKIVDELDLK